MSQNLVVAQEAHFNSEIEYDLGYATALAQESFSILSKSYSGIGMESEDPKESKSFFQKIGKRLGDFFTYIKTVVTRVLDYLLNREKKEERIVAEIKAFTQKHNNLLTADISTKDVEIPKEATASAEVIKKNYGEVVAQAIRKITEEAKQTIADEAEREKILSAMMSRSGDDYIAEARQNQKAEEQETDDKKDAESGRRASDRSRLALTTRLIVDFLREKNAVATTLGVSAKDRVLTAAVILGKRADVSKIQEVLNFVVDDVVDPTVRLLSRIDLKNHPDQASQAIDGYFKVIERDSRVVFGDNSVRDGVEQILTTVRKSCQFDKLPAAALSTIPDLLDVSTELRQKITSAMESLQKSLEKINVEAIGDAMSHMTVNYKDSQDAKTLVPRLTQFQKSVVGALYALRALLKEVQLHGEVLSRLSSFRSVSSTLIGEAEWLKGYASESKDKYAQILFTRVQATLAGHA